MIGERLRSAGARAATALAAAAAFLVGPSGPRRRTYTLPDAAAPIPWERDRELLAAAHAEVAALDREVDGADADELHPVSWQHALEHRAVAHRVLAPGGTAPLALDAMGALVLARRGREALRVAHAGWEWTPLPGCYVHPLHSGPTTRRRVAYRDQVRSILLCDVCRESLQHGRAPEIFDVEHGGRPRHYFDTGVEPWVSTGFGSVVPDLVRALQGGRR